MPRKRRSSSPLELYDDDFDEDASSHSSQPPVQRNAANARERMRMRVLSSAYGRLKTKLPNIPPDTKLSKLDTLRLATLYIKQLITAVENGSGVNAGTENLDTSHLPHCGSGGGSLGGAGGSGIGAFNFHNGGHSGMSWPFEFHQHLQHGNRTLGLTSTRRDWTHMEQSQTYNKIPHSDSNMVTGISYTSMQDAHAHWYPSELAQLDHSQSHVSNGCAYGAFNQQQSRIANSQTHGL
ncbi:uncharacterized protein LOC115633391 [Scaptodrosophila lebanonensis]|uniref:Uncharacterized protein LOC115633391 n=1 Tax=Drosophila lebanonensis TaxID=7225 RepID=A0A6J2UE40_DROLE|nr:uncharacterized protein LOC115633391 [Scaptodrosophila lebanonensis]